MTETCAQEHEGISEWMCDGLERESGCVTCHDVQTCAMG